MNVDYGGGSAALSAWNTLAGLTNGNNFAASKQGVSTSISYNSSASVSELLSESKSSLNDSGIEDILGDQKSTEEEIRDGVNDMNSSMSEKLDNLSDRLDELIQVVTRWFDSAASRVGI